MAVTQVAHGGAASSSTYYKVAQAIGGSSKSLWWDLFSDNIDYNNFLTALYNGKVDEGRVNAIEVEKNSMIVQTKPEGGYRYYISEGYRELDVTGYACEKNLMTTTCEDVIKTTFYWSDVIDDMIVLKSASNTSSGEEIAGSGQHIRIISDLASYFRENSHEKVRELATGTKDGKKIYIQNMIMYAVLVAQSLILFISYIKRLFYVIMLAMIAPIVVVVDFFQKFGK